VYLLICQRLPESETSHRSVGLSICRKSLLLPNGGLEGLRGRMCKKRRETEMLRVAMGTISSPSFHTLPTFDVQHKITKSVQSSHFWALLSG